MKAVTGKTYLLICVNEECNLILLVFVLFFFIKEKLGKVKFIKSTNKIQLIWSIVYIYDMTVIVIVIFYYKLSSVM